MQAQAAEVAAAAQPVIIRNTGGGGSRDVHLESFSISNGGQELIEAWSNAHDEFLDWLSGTLISKLQVSKLSEHVCWCVQHQASA